MKRWKKLRMFFEECERLHFPSSHKSTGRIATSKCVQSYKSQVNLISEIFNNSLNIYKSALVTRSSVKQ